MKFSALRRWLRPGFFAAALAVATLPGVQAEPAPGAPPPAERKTPRTEGGNKPGGDEDRKQRHADRKAPADSIFKKREQLNRLAALPEDKVEAALEEWPPYQEMTLGQRGALLQRIQKMRDRRLDEAKRRAKELGLQIPPEELDAFTNAFWDRKVELDRELWQEIEPIRERYNKRLDDELLEEFAAFRTKDAATDTNAAAKK